MKRMYFTFLAALISAVSFAQNQGGGSGGGGGDLDVNVTTNDGGGDWYASPWVWIVGAAVFILLLVALTRGSGRRAD